MIFARETTPVVEPTAGRLHRLVRDPRLQPLACDEVAPLTRARGKVHAKPMGSAQEFNIAAPPTDKLDPKR